MKNEKQPADNRFSVGNPVDGKHYWLTPPELMALVVSVAGVAEEQIYDPCPFPRGGGFNGLEAEWHDVNYVNPPFGSVIEPGKKKVGMTAWVRKAICEQEKGKTTILVYPLDGWIHLLVKSGAEFISVGQVHWLATEDRQPGGKNSRPIMMFILRGKEV